MQNRAREKNGVQLAHLLCHREQGEYWSHPTATAGVLKMTAQVNK